MNFWLFCFLVPTSFSQGNPYCVKSFSDLVAFMLIVMPLDGSPGSFLPLFKPRFTYEVRVVLAKLKLFWCQRVATCPIANFTSSPKIFNGISSTQGFWDDVVAIDQDNAVILDSIKIQHWMSNVVILSTISNPAISFASTRPALYGLIS